MNVARVLFAPELLLTLTQGRFEVIENAIPPDARLRGVAYDADRGAVSLMIEHPSFAPCAEGEVLPILAPPRVRRLPGAPATPETP